MSPYEHLPLKVEAFAMWVKPVTGIAVFALVLNTTLPAWSADKPKELLVHRVRKAIDRGIQYLRDQEHGTGNWEGADKTSVAWRGGWTSLAMLALLNAGVKHDDPIIDRGLKYLRQIEPSQTYVVALQTMVYAEVGQNVDRQRIQNNVNWLIEAMIVENGRCKGWTYTKTNSQISDNSNTQYALLGLHAGHMAGAKISRDVWLLIRDYYMRTQQADHGWFYNPAFATGTTLTMTTAGLCGLLISGMELNAGREVLRDNGTAANCGLYTENKPVVNALGWVSDHFRIDLPYNTFYNLYGIERAGRLSGQRFFGEHDWYREGCQYLVDTQREDGEAGYWMENKTRDSWPIISTSFALLFLSKGRTPVLISKLVHGPGEDWNNDKNDARHLAEYASKELFRKQPMAWQVFDTRRVGATTDEDVLGLVGDLLQSPILYFNGHLDPYPYLNKEKVEGQLLRQYIEQGGFILAEACCGRKEFDEGFRRLMKELFPDNPLKRLPPEHPIWQAHAAIPPTAFPLEGIEYGCKTVVVYSPQDLSCLWESNQWQNGRGQLAFRMAGNIIAYATGMEPPKPRLSPTDVVQDDPSGKEIPRGYLKVAQLRHAGDWQPAPHAMRNLMDHLRKRARLDVALQTKPIYATDPDLLDFRFLYMHGRGSFTLSPEAIKNLRLDLETGGLLFADACCGKKAFDASFRELAAQLFPDKKLELIPVTDEFYGQDVNGTAIRSVKCRTEAAGGAGQTGEYRDMAPYLEGIKIGNRWAVVYSKYDIGCALEKHQSTDCLGHDHESALTLGSAAVLYALKR
jgi:hypothetical protein